MLHFYSTTSYQSIWSCLISLSSSLDRSTYILVPLGLALSVLGLPDCTFPVGTATMSCQSLGGVPSRLIPCSYAVFHLLDEVVTTQRNASSKHQNYPFVSFSSSLPLLSCYYGQHGLCAWVSCFAYWNMLLLTAATHLLLLYSLCLWFWSTLCTLIKYNIFTHYLNVICWYLLTVLLISQAIFKVDSTLLLCYCFLLYMFHLAPPPVADTEGSKYWYLNAASCFIFDLAHIGWQFKNCKCAIPSCSTSMIL